MNFEKPSMEQPKKLDEEKAHQEANMLRASMRMDPESGKLLRTESEIRDKEYKAYNEDLEALFLKPEEYLEKIATRKDYEVAFEALNELEKLAEKDPELLVKLTQYAQISFIGATVPLALIGSFMSGTFGKLHNLKEIPKGIDEELGKAENFLISMRNQIFSDARSKLERLEAKGEKFGQSQNEAGKDSVNTEY